MLIIALPAAAALIGLSATIAALAITAAAVTLSTIWKDRRERALSNPYRAILQLDPRTTQPGQTVIAPAAAHRPEPAADRRAV